LAAVIAPRKEQSPAAASVQAERAGSSVVTSTLKVAAAAGFERKSARKAIEKKTLNDFIDKKLSPLIKNKLQTVRSNLRENRLDFELLEDYKNRVLKANQDRRRRSPGASSKFFGRSFFGGFFGIPSPAGFRFVLSISTNVPTAVILS
jgi:hypothetical protein